MGDVAGHLIGASAKTAATDDGAARAWVGAWGLEAVLEVPILRPGRGGNEARAGRARI